MARIEQVIHVKKDGEVRECALFDSASDIPSPAEAREFGLNGAKIYGAVLDGGDTSDDGEWVRDSNATELAFHDGSSLLRLLTTPYFVRPKTESLEFGADGGTVYLEDYSSRAETHEGILSTNGTLYDYSCDRDFISLENEGAVRFPIWAVVCEANTTTSARTFTVTLTYSFADGSTRDITFTGTQAAAEEKEAWLRVDPDSLTFDADGGSQDVTVDSSSDDFEVESVDGDWITTRVTRVVGSVTGTVWVAAEANTETSARTGSVTLANGDGCTAEIAVEQKGADSGGGTGETRTLTITISRSGMGTTGGDDWSARNAPMVTVYADGEAVLSGNMTVTSTSGAVWSAEIAYGAQVEYTVAKDGYVTVTGSVTMDSDRTVSVSLRSS